MLLRFADFMTDNLGCLGYLEAVVAGKGITPAGYEAGAAAELFRCGHPNPDEGKM
jgi:hypothetical protein